MVVRMGKDWCVYVGDGSGVAGEGGWGGRKEEGEVFFAFEVHV
jgi:hypothetical protein